MHLCLFDIDGTLIDTGGAGVRAFRATLAEEFSLGEVSREIMFAGRSDRAIATDFFLAHGLDASAENWQRFRRGYVRRLAEFLPQMNGTALPGVVDLLDELLRRGDVLLGLLTGNVRDGAERKLSHYGLWDRFEFGGFGDDYLERNDIAAMALSEAHRHVGNNSNGDTIDGTVVVFGDTLHDIVCARSIDALVVAVPTGNTSSDVLRGAGPDLLVESLAQLDPILQLLA
jgi:phosphoglycolate phosphatase-like HAD superfamily hydrolase